MTPLDTALEPRLKVEGLAKSFTLHAQGGITLPVFQDVALDVNPGECLVLSGPSGTGKSSLMRLLYANYLAEAGRILVRHRTDWLDLVSAAPHEILEVRRRTIGYVSQFLRVVPRVPSQEVVAEPLIALGVSRDEALDRAAEMLARLNIPAHLWSLAPATFSGGEQQRVNLARGFVVDYPVLLLDEPTASLDAENRQVVIDLIEDAKARGAAMVGIFHDADVRDAVADRLFQMPGSGAS